ncbi:hypothetical protein CYY_005236 [Polysphondylium violaceum]|uniref:HP domain-containing protein n=1 Tax=Polysphondylium violaceum TaxID=133409 RepID=A0A8J4Q3K9_9MYCE|nr:hypothetical protein CYY_005236 [Polysphondylium violaceum]
MNGSTKTSSSTTTTGKSRIPVRKTTPTSTTLTTKSSGISPKSTTTTTTITTSKIPSRTSLTSASSLSKNTTTTTSSTSSSSSSSSTRVTKATTITSTKTITTSTSSKQQQQQIEENIVDKLQSVNITTEEDEVHESYSVSSKSIQDTSAIEAESTTTLVLEENQSFPPSIATSSSSESGLKKPVSTTTISKIPTGSGIKKPVSSTTTTATKTSTIAQRSTLATSKISTTSSAKSSSIVSSSSSSSSSTTTATATATKSKAIGTSASTKVSTLSIKKPTTTILTAEKKVDVSPAIKKPTTTTTTPSKPTTTAAIKKPVATTTTIKKPTAATTIKKPASATTIKKPAASAATKPAATTIKKPAATTTIKKPATTTTIKKPAATSTLKKPATAATSTIKKPATLAAKKPAPTVIKTTTSSTAAASKVSLATPTKATPVSTPIKTISTTTKSILGSPMENQQMLSSVKGSRPAGPANRKKPTVNPVRNLAGKQSTTTNSSKLSSALIKSNYVTGFGLLASVNNGTEAADQLKKLNHVNSSGNSSSSSSSLRLIKFNGKKSIVGRLVEVSSHSIKSNCCFVLDAGQKIYEWRGQKSSKVQQAMALDLSGRIRNKERGSRSQSIVIEDGKHSPSEQEFWELLSVKSRPKDIVEESQEEEKKSKIKDILYCLINNSNGQQVTTTTTTTSTTTTSSNKTPIKTPVKRSITTPSSLKKPTTPSTPQQQQPLSTFPLKADQIKNPNGKNGLIKEMLKSSNSYILDSVTEIYLWVGKETEDFIRKQSMAKAQEIQAIRKNRPAWVTIQRIVEGAETELFKEKFMDWSKSLPISMAPIPKGRVAETKKEEFKVESIKLNQTLPHSFTTVIDDYKGVVQVWRVRNHNMEPIPNHLYGHFFDGESYVIIYKYIHRNKEVNLTYFWQGKKSTINEKGESARLAVDMDDILQLGVTKKIRVVQNKEPIHFLNIFGGFIIIHSGVLELEKVKDVGILSLKPRAMYHIRSCNHFDSNSNWRVIELDNVSSKNLNTNDWFIIKTNQDRYYVWKGLNSNTSNDNRLESIVNKLIVSKDNNSNSNDGESIKQESIESLDHTLIICNENEEPNSFWKYIDQQDGAIGNIDYFRDIQLLQPIMYQCSLSSGTFTVDRVFEWDQDDLDDEDVMIFDCHTMVYLWIGRRSTQDERKVSMTVVLDLIKKINVESRLKLIKDKQAQQQQMDGADDIVNDIDINLEDYVYLVDSGLEPLEFTKYFHDSWDTRKSRGINQSATTLIKVAEYLKALNRTYTLQELRNNPPRALDSTKLENYLSDQDFESIFKMDKSTFSQQKLWNQEKLKKSVGLF